MMRLLLFPALFILIVSCKKTSSSPANTPSNSRLVSARTYQSNVLATSDTFVYNSAGNLVLQKEENYTNGVSTGNAFTLTFNYTGTGNDPSSYTLTDPGGSYTYTLSYDAQGRVVKDTMIPDLASIASTFSYPGNNIVYTSGDNASTDTLYLSNENIVKSVQASIPPDPTTDVIITYTYDHSYPNPFYFTGQTQNVRILISKIDAWELNQKDCVSKNCFTSVKENNGFAAQVNYTLDASGKVIQASSFNVTGSFLYK